jgi:methanogenic corrinoid protein MtbC1
LRRLTLLARATASGRSIGQVAGLSGAELEQLIRDDGTALVPQPRPMPRGSDAEPAEQLLRQAIAAVEHLDGPGLDRVLLRSAVLLDTQLLVDSVVIPLLRRIGTLWREQNLGPANERLASGIVRRFLEWVLETTETSGSAPMYVCATLNGHRHELGAILSGVVASGVGWSPLYLGPELPAEEIAIAARRLQARAVGLSAIYPLVDSEIPNQLRIFKDMLGRDTRLYVGGPAFVAHRDVAEAMGVEVPETLTDLRSRLAGHLNELTATGWGAGEPRPSTRALANRLDGIAPRRLIRPSQSS